MWPTVVIWLLRKSLLAFDPSGQVCQPCGLKFADETIICCLNNFWLLAAKFSMSLKSRQKIRTNLPISGGGQFYLSATVGQLEVDNEVNWRRACVLDRCWEQTPRCRNASNDLIGVYQNQAEPIFSLILCSNRSLWQGWRIRNSLVSFQRIN